MSISRKKTSRATLKIEKKKQQEAEEQKECGNCKKQNELLEEMESMIDELNATNLKQKDEIKRLK